MNVTVRLSKSLCVATVFLLTGIGIAESSAQKMRITGKVRLQDQKGLEVKGARVRIYESGREVCSTITGRRKDKSDGYYELTIDRPWNISSLVLRVDPPRLTTHGPSIVSKLSNKDDQSISVVLLSREYLAACLKQVEKGSAEGGQDLLTQYQSLEICFFLEIMNGSKRRNIVLRYGEFVRAISPSSRGMPVREVTGASAVIRSGVRLQETYGF